MLRAATQSTFSLPTDPVGAEAGRGTSSTNHIAATFDYRTPRAKLTLLCSLALASFAHAALWESNDWALSGRVVGATGYDSNLTASHDGPEDYFVFAGPDLTFFRRNSSSDFRIRAGAVHTEFINGELPAQTDLLGEAIYAYPNADNVIPVYRLDASWKRIAPPNQYLGQRIQTDKAAIAAEGYLPLSGKLGLRGTADFTSETFDAPTLNQNKLAKLFLGLAYKRNERLESSFNVGFASGHSNPNDPTRVGSDVDSQEIYATARARGEISPKLTGSIYAGFGQVKYSGGFTNTETGPVGGADLTWGFDPRRTLVVAAYNGVQYSPDGQSVYVTRAFVTFTHVIISRWQYVLRAGPTHSSYYREVRQRTDDSWDLGTEFAYQPSERFRVSIALSHTTQNSDNLTAEFTRNLISLGSSYRF